MPDITVCLLNWKRPENLERIIPDLHRQTHRPRIFLWDNAGDLKRLHPGAVDWLIRSDPNKRCWPRWHMASMADTKYVMSLDDDLTLSDPQLLEQMIAIMDKDNEPDRIYGLEGVVLEKGKSYTDCVSRELRYQAANGHPVDIVKGRLMAFRRACLNEDVRLYQNITEDDIALSGLLSKYREHHHRVLPVWRASVTELPDPHALFRQPGHWDRRNQAVHDFFPWYRAD